MKTRGWRGTKSAFADYILGYTVSIRSPAGRAFARSAAIARTRSNIFRRAGVSSGGLRISSQTSLDPRKLSGGVRLLLMASLPAQVYMTAPPTSTSRGGRRRESAKADLGAVPAPGFQPGEREPV